MKRLVYVAPHLSTGGMPQYLYKQIELLKEEFDVYCIEWADVTGGVLVVQRNKIKSLLGKNLITLGENKGDLIKKIKEIKPDIVHLQEIPEIFTIPYEIAFELYKEDRSYLIIETSHDSSFNVNNKVFFPDRFLMVSQYQVNDYKKLCIPCDLVEYPIEFFKRTKTKEEAQKALGMDPKLKHVINVGLFTPRKNQAEVVEYAKSLKGQPIQFHFIGNHADNFKFYWEPIMKAFPDNCKWWNERTDVETFYQAADLFLFTSRGSNTDKETMPLVIREAISWQVPSLIYNLPVYLNYFDKYKNIEYLDFNNPYKNCDKILEKLGMQKNEIDSYFDLRIEPQENKIFIDYKRPEKNSYKISIKEKDSNAPMYWFDATFENYSNWWTVPIPTSAAHFATDPAIGTISVEFYDTESNLLFVKDLFVKNVPQKQTRLNLKNPFDCLFNNYNEMFLEKKYDCYRLDNLETVFDIGANSGLFSLLMINKGAKKVYAFEPNQDSLINLREVTADKSVEIVEKAVYTKDGDLSFYIDPNNTTIGSLSENHLQIHAKEVNKIAVPAVSLKTFIAENAIKRVSLLKMDIEGAEYEIIENLEDEVFDLIDNFLIEYHDNEGEKAQNLVNKLISKGFDVEQIRDQNSKNNDSIKETYKTSKLGTLLAKKSPEERILTVLIPTYNHEKYIEECVDSVLKQETLFNFNIIISEDCSTDSTWEILQKYKGVKNITLTHNEVNEGANTTRLNNIMKNIKSKYVTILDGDDYYTNPEKLQKQVDFLENNKEYSIYSVGFHQKESDSDTNFLSHSFYGIKEEVILKDNLEANYVSFGFMFRNPFSKNEYQFPDWVFSKDIFDGYWALNCILLENGRGRNDKWIGGVYRITPNGAYGEKSPEWKMEVQQKQSDIIKSVFKIVDKNYLVDQSNIDISGIYSGHFKVQYKGVPYLKCPMDYVMYQMLIMNLKPDLIIEIGTLHGGGALYYADLLYLIGKGEVHTINLNNEVWDQKVFNHGRIKFFYGGFQNYDLEKVKGFETVLVIDDGSHSYEDVLATLNKFSSVVTKNSYFIVEDGVVDFLGLKQNFNGGPRKAINEFLQSNSNFEIDRSLCDFFGTNATFNPDGYLKRIG